MTHGFGEDHDHPGPEPEPDAGAEPRSATRREHTSAMKLMRTRPCASMAMVGLAASLVALGFEFAYLRRLANPTGTDIVRNAGYGAWVLAWMMLVTFPLRTFRLRDVVRFWLLGFFAAAGIVALAGAGVTAAIEPGVLRTAIVVPILEEVVKALLLVAFLVFAVRGRSREPSITDMVIVGFALGAAFAVHEDGLWVRVMADGFGSGWGMLFPSFLWERFVMVGHGGLTALVGLGLGLAWHLRRHRLAWILAVVPLALATLEHMSINWVLIEASEGRRGIGFTLRELGGHGSRVAQILLAGFALALVIDWLTARRQLSSSPLPAWSTFPGIRARVRSLPGVRAKLLGGILLLGERRARLGVRYARARSETTAEQPVAGAPPTR